MAEDVKKACKLSGIELNAGQLDEVATYLSSNIPLLKPLTQRHLLKEVEPTGYNRTLSESEVP